MVARFLWLVTKILTADWKHEQQAEPTRPILSSYKSRRVYRTKQPQVKSPEPELELNKNVFFFIKVCCVRLNDSYLNSEKHYVNSDWTPYLQWTYRVLNEK